MSNDDSINNEIINTAQQIGLPNIADEIFDSQFIYWQSIQTHMCLASITLSGLATIMMAG